MNDEIPHPSMAQLPRIREMIEKGLENGTSHPDVSRSILDLAIDNYWLETEISEFLTQYKAYKHLADTDLLATVEQMLENREGLSIEDWQLFVDKMKTGQITLS